MSNQPMATGNSLKKISGKIHRCPLIKIIEESQILHLYLLIILKSEHLDI